MMKLKKPKNTKSTHEMIEDKGEAKGKEKDDPKYIPSKPYKPLIPFPQRLAC